MSRVKIAAIPLVLILLVALVEVARVWWYRGYSIGTRTGTIRKVSVKGPPYCKYLSGELALQGSLPGQQVEIFEFSVDDDHDTNPLVQQLQAAEKSSDRVTLHYRQDLHSLFRCTPSEYFITGVEK
jgi:hypothetical protein